MALHLRQTPVRAKRQPGAIQCAVVLFGPQPAGASPFLADVLAVLAADPLPPPQQRLVTDIDPGSALQRGLGRDRGTRNEQSSARKRSMTRRNSSSGIPVSASNRA